jgi:peptide/nickel transport system permease protein
MLEPVPIDRVAAAESAANAAARTAASTAVGADANADASPAAGPAAGLDAGPDAANAPGLVGVARPPARRGTFVGACAVLLALCGIAAWAPLLANDRPLYLQGVDRALAEEALRRLPALAAELEQRVGQSEAEYLAARRDGSKQSHAEVIRTLATGAAVRARLLARHGDPALRQQLLAQAAACQELAARCERGERARAAADAHALVEFCAAWTDPQRAPSRGGWRAATTSPVFEAYGWIDWCGLLGWPLLAYAVVARWRSVRSGKHVDHASVAARALAAAIGVALLAFALQAWMRDERSARRSDWKAALADGRYSVERVVYPPLAMGLAETHPEESWLPPSWWRTSADCGVVLEPPPGEASLQSPWRHPLGTDSLGRDLAARLIWGARASLGVGAAAAALLVLIGCCVGALAGYVGGWLDWVALRGIEIALCVPALFLALAVLAFTDPRVLDPALAVVLVIGALGWPGIARLLRAEIRRVRELDYVQSARAAGLHPLRILGVHVLPHALPPVIVAASFAVGACLLSEAALSYLGLGVRPPLASWGALASESRNAEHWWVQLFPGLAIFATAAACNMIGEALRDRLDPRHREEQR